MSGSTDVGSMILPIAGAIAILLGGFGFFYVCLRLGALVNRVNKTIDEVDVAALSAPIATTLTHVGGIADTADTAVARLGAAVVQLETGLTALATLLGTFASAVRAKTARKATADE